MLYAHVSATTRLDSWTQVSARSPLSWLLFGQGWWLTAISCNLTRSVNVFLWSDTTKTFCTLWYFVIIFVQFFHAEPAVYVQHAHGYFQLFFFKISVCLCTCMFAFLHQCTIIGNWIWHASDTLCRLSLHWTSSSPAWMVLWLENLDVPWLWSRPQTDQRTETWHVAAVHLACSNCTWLYDALWDSEAI